MKMKFEIEIDTDEATPDEIVKAVEDAMLSLDMPNGDTMYCDTTVSYIEAPQPQVPEGYRVQFTQWESFEAVRVGGDVYRYRIDGHEYIESAEQIAEKGGKLYALVPMIAAAQEEQE